MQTSRVPTTSNLESTAAHKALVQRQKPAGYSASPITLAKVDFGLFRALRRLGTSRDRICAALCISNSDFDYISGLTSL